MIEPRNRPVDAADIVESVLVSLAAPRHRLAGADVVVPHRPGLYAIYGGPEEWADLGLGTASDDRPLYVGKSESSLADRDIRTHFGNGRTGSSTVRRTFAALLHDELGLRGIPRNLARPERFANYGLSPEHDKLLTDWMRTRLTLAVWPNDGSWELSTIERAVLRAWQPPLNLKDVVSPWSARIREARRRMAAEARTYAGAGQAQVTPTQILEADDSKGEQENLLAGRTRLGKGRPRASWNGNRPEALARDIGMSAKVLRGWLRRQFPRDAGDHWQPWFLTNEQVAAAEAHFGKRDGQGSEPLIRHCDP